MKTPLLLRRRCCFVFVFYCCHCFNEDCGSSPYTPFTNYYYHQTTPPPPPHTHIYTYTH
ncbi:hypothetical protein OAV88_01730 [bacterium]|nr:hypothetical protein [bacterium]